MSKPACQSLRGILLYAVLFLGSCASQIEPLPRGSSLRVVLAPGAEFSEELSYDSSTSDYVTTGAAAGGLVGSTVWGLACGPWFVLCALGGGLAGSIVGATAGGVTGVVTAVSEEEQQQLTQIFGAVFSTKTQGRYFEEYFNRNLKELWSIESGDADYTITVRLDQLSLLQKGTDSFSLGLAASLTVTDQDLQPDDDSTWFSFQHVTPERELSYFLDEEQGNFKYELERGLDVLTTQMVGAF